ncbi:hypothetical protein H0H92_016048 [Tricholoma furcatifolium]|nr:hypothetical protein H0H92_016048 [Tricholoma furcatifolium]
MWTLIKVEQCFTTDKSKMKLEHTCIKRYLSLSKSCPLTIDLNFSSARFSDQPDPDKSDEGDIEDDEAEIKDDEAEYHAFWGMQQDILEALRDHAYRFQDFKSPVNRWDFSVAESYLPLSGVSMPMLEHWSVRNNRDNAGGPGLDPELYLTEGMEGLDDKKSSYPNLKSVELHGALLDWEYFTPRNLVSLEINMLPESLHCPSLQMILEANASTLEHLMLLTALNNKIKYTETILMPQLTTLELGYLKDPNSLISFLNAIHVPRLQAFSLSDNYWESQSFPNSPWEVDYYDLGILVEVLIRRLPLEQLTSLELCNVSFYPFRTVDSCSTFAECLLSLIDQIIIFCGFFCRLTGLAYLRLVNPDSLTITLLSWLTWSLLVACPVPGLKTLCISPDNVMTELESLTTPSLGMLFKFPPLLGQLPLTRTPEDWDQFSKSQWLAVLRSLVLKSFVSRSLGSTEIQNGA